MKKKSGIAESSDSMKVDSVTISDIDTLLSPDSVYPDSSFSSAEDTTQTILNSDSVKVESESILEKIWGNLIFPDYSKGTITGFGLSLSYITNIIDYGIKADSWIALIIPISFILSLTILFIPFRKLKLLNILSVIGCLCLFIFLLLSIPNIDELLFGFWIAIVFYFLNSIILFINLRKANKNRLGI